MSAVTAPAAAAVLVATTFIQSEEKQEEREDWIKAMWASEWAKHCEKPAEARVRESVVMDDGAIVILSQPAAPTFTVKTSFVPTCLSPPAFPINF